MTTSGEVYPQFREFERFTTTAMNAFIGPPVGDYISRFEQTSAAFGVDAVHVMQSNGGITTEGLVVEKPVSLLFSGPAAGILGGRWRGGADTADGRPTIRYPRHGWDERGRRHHRRRRDRRGERQEDIHRRLPGDGATIDTETIGGGGSLACADEGGAFRVSPRSAGAAPGPGSCDRGGADPTATDAHVALRRIREEYFLGGRDRARRGRRAGGRRRGRRRPAGDGHGRGRA